MRKAAVLFIVSSFVLFGLCFRVYAKDGKHKEYYSTGELKSVVVYKDGKKEGVEEKYDKDGTLIKELVYEGGQLVGAVATQPKRDLGPIKFLLNWRIWLSVLFITGLLWLLFIKVILKGKM